MVKPGCDLSTAKLQMLCRGEIQSTYTVVLAEAPPLIDGNLDDAIWQEKWYQEMCEYVSLAERFYRQVIENKDKPYDFK